MKTIAGGIDALEQEDNLDLGSLRSAGLLGRGDIPREYHGRASEGSTSIRRPHTMDDGAAVSRR